MRAPDWLTARPVAHRGLHNFSAGIIENMPAAFAAAMAGSFAIETDLQISADGEAMVTHDDNLGRLTEGDAPVRSMTAADLCRVRHLHTDEHMLTLGQLFEMVDGRVPLVLELKSHFDKSTKLVDRVGELLKTYRGPVALMSFDPDVVQAIRERVPHTVRGIVAQRSYDDDEWAQLSRTQRSGMMGLRHAFRTRPHFVAFWVRELPAPAPWIARHLFGCPLLTWTVRTAEQRRTAERYADQMIFEGFRPE